jgi:hypothetical protein
LGEPHNKVFIGVIDSLKDFIVIFKSDCSPQWVADLLTELMRKMGADMLQPTEDRVLALLHYLRESFPTEQQLALMFKLIVEAKHNTLDPRANFNVKAKRAILEFIGFLLEDLTTESFENVFATVLLDCRHAIQKVIDMVIESKSIDLRKFGCTIVANLFELNPRLFSRILAGFPPRIC